MANLIKPSKFVNYDSRVVSINNLLCNYNSRVVIYKHKMFIRLATGEATDQDMMTSTSDFCGQSYKQFVLVIYKSRIVIWGIFKSCMTLEL